MHYIAGNTAGTGEKKKTAKGLQCQAASAGVDICPCDPVFLWGQEG